MVLTNSAEAMMETLLGGVAFALLMAAPVLAVIAVRAGGDEDPSGGSGPNPTTVGPSSLGGAEADIEQRVARINQAKQAIRNSRAARAIYIRAGAARLLSRIKAATARLLAPRPKAAPGL
jgi:hypothetical protein